MSHRVNSIKTGYSPGFCALAKLLEEARSMEWSINLLIAIKTAAEMTGGIPYQAFSEAIAFAEQVLRCRDYYAGTASTTDVPGKHPISIAIEGCRSRIQDMLRNDFDLACLYKTRFEKKQLIWILSTIRILQRTLALIAEVLPTCKSKIHSAIRSLDVFLCAILTAQTPCFAFAALDKRTTDAIKTKLCDDITELVAEVQKLERLRHKELESRQENTLLRNFIAANLPPPELPPQMPQSIPRRRERELTDVDFAHMEAVFQIRDIYRRYKGADSYPAIAKRIFKNFNDRLTVGGIVMVSHETLATHAKKKSWPPQRWKTAYNRQKS